MSDRDMSDKKAWPQPCSYCIPARLTLAIRTFSFPPELGQGHLDQPVALPFLHRERITWLRSRMSFLSKDRMPQQLQTTANDGVKPVPPIVFVKDLQTFRPEDTPDDFLQALAKEVSWLP